MSLYPQCFAQINSDGVQESPTCDLANDCSQFVNGYFEIISASPPHIYHSALVLVPKGSIIWKLYGLYANPFVRVVHGASVSWGPNIATTTFPTTIWQAVWSPCSRFIAAIAWGNTLMVDILDPVTLQRLQALKGPPWSCTQPPTLSFSPDSCVLTCSSDEVLNHKWQHSVVVWDLQTGGIIVSAAKERGQSRRIPYLGSKSSITYSLDGKMVGILSRGPDDIEMISIYSLASGVHIHTHLLSILSHNHRSLWKNGTVLNYIWAHRESLRFMTSRSTRIIIWEVGFTSETAATKVETMFVSDDQFALMLPRCRMQVLFLPTLSRLAVADKSGLLVCVRNTCRNTCIWFTFFPLFSSFLSPF